MSMNFQDYVSKKSQLSVIGLGYVGLPIALELAKKFKVIGFDINPKRVELRPKSSFFLYSSSSNSR